MKYTKLKEIAESEGLKLRIRPNVLLVGSSLDPAAIVIDLNQANHYTMRSGDLAVVSPRVATAIAEFSLTPWIQREVPDKGDQNDEDDD